MLPARARHRIIALALPVLASCRSEANPTGPHAATPGTMDAPVAMSVQAVSDTQSFGTPLLLAEDPVVLVRDQYGRPMSYVVVSFIITGGGGSIENPLYATNAQGHATGGKWTLGTAIGANSLVARVPGVGEVAFKATALGPADADRYELRDMVPGLPPASAGTVLLYRDNQFEAITRWRGQKGLDSNVVRGTFARSGTSIHLDSEWLVGDGLFEANLLTVTWDDFCFPPYTEVYARAYSGGARR